MKCAPGKKLVGSNNGIPWKCEPCASGTFNANHDASTQCTKHKACTDAKVWEAGTASKDAVCTIGEFRCGVHDR